MCYVGGEHGSGFRPGPFMSTHPPDSGSDKLVRTPYTLCDAVQTEVRVF
jgi:hypothetical protein